MFNKNNVYSFFCQQIVTVNIDLESFWEVQMQCHRNECLEIYAEISFNFFLIIFVIQNFVQLGKFQTNY